MSGVMRVYLYHYFERGKGPFLNLSDLSCEMAEEKQREICALGKGFAAGRNENYIRRRRELEGLAREIFISKGGKPVRQRPQYMVVEACDFLRGWYIDGAYIKEPVEAFDKQVLSFSYGDMFPTFSPLVNDGKEYRRQIYTYGEILKLIDKYGLPQEWNEGGQFGPERYIEVQVWSDEVISKYYPKRNR